MIDKRNDAVFLPGKIHGDTDSIYIIYLNEDAGENGEGCVEIERMDYMTLKEVFDKYGEDVSTFFGMLPDYFHGRWQYAPYGTPNYDSLLEDYDKADFIVGQDGNIEDELNFIMKWANERLEFYKKES